MDISSKDDVSSEKFNLRIVTRQITTSVYMQAALSVSSQDAGLMTIATHGNVFERRCSMPAQVLMEILPGEPTFVYTGTLTAKLANLPKLLRASFASSAPNMHHTGQR